MDSRAHSAQHVVQTLRVLRSVIVLRVGERRRHCVLVPSNGHVQFKYRQWGYKWQWQKRKSVRVSRHDCEGGIVSEIDCATVINARA